MHNLFGFGQAITSDLQIAGTLTRPDSVVATAPSLSITLTAEYTGKDLPIYSREGQKLLFSPPGVGTYRCLPRSISIAPEPGFDPEALSALLIATAIPATQWMRGHFMLHASAVYLPGGRGAIAIAGHSGSGKSTVAAQLLEQGAGLLADDSLRIVADGDHWSAAGLPGGLHQIGALDARRRFEPVASHRSIGEMHLSAILVLGERTNGPEFYRLDPTEAMERLLTMRHRPRIPAFLGMHKEMMDLVAGIARSIPVYDWRRCTTGLALMQSEWNELQRCCGIER